MIAAVHKSDALVEDAQPLRSGAKSGARCTAHSPRLSNSAGLSRCVTRSRAATCVRIAAETQLNDGIDPAILAGISPAKSWETSPRISPGKSLGKSPGESPETSLANHWGKARHKCGRHRRRLPHVVHLPHGRTRDDEERSMTRCLACHTLIARGSRCAPCATEYATTWRQRMATSDNHQRNPPTRRRLRPATTSRRTA